MTALRLALALIRAIARFVPRRQRDEWQREWDAELRHHASDACDPGGLVQRSTGAVADAVYLRSQALQLDLIVHDLTLAVRNAFRRPGFTLLVVLTLALGIGVNSAVFALLDGILLRPLPYRDPSRLVFVWQTLPSKNVMELEATPYDFEAWRGLRGISELAMASEYAALLGRQPGAGAGIARHRVADAAARHGAANRPAVHAGGRSRRHRARGDPQRRAVAAAIRRRPTGARTDDPDQRRIENHRRRDATRGVAAGTACREQRPLAPGADVARRAHQRGQPQLSLPRPASAGHDTRTGFRRNRRVRVADGRRATLTGR